MGATDTKFVRGAAKLSQRIQTIRNATALPPLIDEITDLLLKRTLRRFDAQVDPDGKKWAPLKDVTLRRKKQGGFGDKPSLVRTQTMRDAIHRIRGGAGSTFFTTGAGSRIGIDDPAIAEYAKAQNKGTKTIPARRFLGLGALDIKAVDGLLRRKAQQIDTL